METSVSRVKRFELPQWMLLDLTFACIPWKRARDGYVIDGVRQIRDFDTAQQIFRAAITAKLAAREAARTRQITCPRCGTKWAWPLAEAPKGTRGDLCDACFAAWLDEFPKLGVEGRTAPPTAPVEDAGLEVRVGNQPVGWVGGRAPQVRKLDPLNAKQAERATKGLAHWLHAGMARGTSGGKLAKCSKCGKLIFQPAIETPSSKARLAAHQRGCWPKA